jgi:hypothetical protein
LEPLGFRIDRVEGVGGPALVFLQEKIQAPLRRKFGELAAATVAAISIPFVALDKSTPVTPFSIYVRAVRADCT